MEFVEADCVAPAGDDAGGLVCLAGVVPGIFEGCVGEDQGWGAIRLMSAPQAREFSLLAAYQPDTQSGV